MSSCWSCRLSSLNTQSSLSSAHNVQSSRQFFKQCRGCQSLQAMCCRLEYFLVELREEWCGSHYTPRMFKCLGMMYSCWLDWICSSLCCSRRRVVSHPWTGYTPLLDSLLLIYFTNWGPILGAKVCHQYFLIPISLLNALQLAAGATGLFSQGVTAVVHGCFIHALGPRVNLTHSWRGGSQCHLWLSR